MTRNNFSVNANVEGLIRTLRTAGVISTDSSAQKLRDLNNGLTETEIQAIIDSLDYGAGAGGTVGSTGDLLLLIDSDALPSPWTSNKNYLRVGRAAAQGPLPPSQLLMSVYGAVPSPSGQGSQAQLVIGTDTQRLNETQTQPNTKYSARLFFSAYTDGSDSPQVNGVIAGGFSEGVGNSTALRMHSHHPVQITSGNADLPVSFYMQDQTYYSGNDTRIIIAPIQPTSLGGFAQSTPWPSSMDVTFYVGEVYDGSVGTNSFLIQKKSYGFDLLNNREDTGESGGIINISTRAEYYDNRIMVNGYVNAGRRDPSAHGNAIFSVYGIEYGNNNCVAAIVNVNDTYPVSGAYGNVLLIDSYSNSIHMLIKARSSNPLSTIFTVDNSGNVKADGSYTSPAADVAEWADVDSNYAYGTVLIIGANSVLTASVSTNDKKIMGVVAKKPGVEFGRGVEETVPENKAPVTVCGFTPVNCTTAGGSIAAGDLLVSSTDGMAQKAPEPPTPGTLLGKAMEPLEQIGEDPVTGLIKVFVNLQ